MPILRQVVGDTLRALRLRQRRTLREVSATARVSLGYLSEVERGQKEPSSELLAAICQALDVEMSELFAAVSQALGQAERLAVAGQVAAVPGAGAARITPAPSVGTGPATRAAVGTGPVSRTATVRSLPTIAA